MRLSGKVALVTGGTRGIGRATVERLAREGAAVGFTGRSEDAGREVQEGVRASGGRALYVRADNGIESDVRSAIEAVVAEFGSLTTLVNNAISTDAAGSGRDSHVDVMDDETFDTIMTVALKGAFWASKHAIP